MVYHTNHFERGKLVWAWIQDGEERATAKQIKWVAALPYQGFEYLWPDEMLVQIQHPRTGYITGFKGVIMGQERGADVPLKRNEKSSIFADSREELIEAEISKINEKIVELEKEKLLLTNYKNKV